MTAAGKNSAITLIRKAFGSGDAAMHSNGAHTFATWQSAKVTECGGHAVIIPRRSGWPAEVQGFPEWLPLLAHGEADRSAPEVAVEQVVADAEVVVHEGRVAIQDICCG
jgi:hypothetical protein